jgi:hypothetical protein
VSEQTRSSHIWDPPDLLLVRSTWFVTRAWDVSRADTADSTRVCYWCDGCGNRSVRLSIRESRWLQRFTESFLINLAQTPGGNLCPELGGTGRAGTSATLGVAANTSSTADQTSETGTCLRVTDGICRQRPMGSKRHRTRLPGDDDGYGRSAFAPNK